MKKSILFVALGLLMGSLAGCKSDESSPKIDYIKENLPTENEIREIPSPQKLKVEEFTYPEGSELLNHDAGEIDYLSLRDDGLDVLVDSKGNVGIYNTAYKKYIYAPQIPLADAISIENDIQITKIPVNGIDELTFVAINRDDKTLILDELGNVYYDSVKKDISKIKIHADVDSVSEEEALTYIVFIENISSTGLPDVFTLTIETGEFKKIDEEEFINSNSRNGRREDLSKYGAEGYELVSYTNGLVEVYHDGKLETSYTVNTDHSDLEDVVEIGTKRLFCYESDVHYSDPNFTFRDFDDDRFKLEYVLIDLLTGETKNIEPIGKITKSRKYKDENGNYTLNVVRYCSIDEKTKMLNPFAKEVLINEDLELVEDFTNKNHSYFFKFGDIYLNGRTYTLYDKDLNEIAYIGEYEIEDFDIENRMFLLSFYDSDVEESLYGVVDFDGKVIYPFDTKHITLVPEEGSMFVSSENEAQLLKYDGTVIKEYKYDYISFNYQYNNFTFYTYDDEGRYLNDLFGNSVLVENDSKLDIREISNKFVNSVAITTGDDPVTHERISQAVYFNNSDKIKCNTYGSALTTGGATGTTPYDSVKLTLGEEFVITQGGGEEVFFEYTPAETGVYDFEGEAGGSITLYATKYKGLSQQVEIPYVDSGSILMEGFTYKFEATNSTELKVKLLKNSAISELTSEGETIPMENTNSIIRSFKVSETGYYKFPAAEKTLIMASNNPSFKCTPRSDDGVYKLTAGVTYIYVADIINTPDYLVKMPEKVELSEKLYTVTNDETHPWTYDEKENTYVATGLGDEEEMTLTFTFEDVGDFDFTIKASTESNSDYLIVKEGSIDVDEISGQEIRHILYTGIKPGDTMTFTYKKDYSYTYGQDAVAIINPVFIPKAQD